MLVHRCRAAMSGAKCRLKRRVSLAYYGYGRFCASHPYSCVTLSLLTVMLLSYPVTNVQFFRHLHPEIYRQQFAGTDGSHEESVAPAQAHADAPDWLAVTPSRFIQHIVIQGAVENMEQVHDFLSLSFAAADAVHRFVSRGYSGELCERVPRSTVPMLPQHQCLLLSPALFWNNDRRAFDYSLNRTGQIITGHPCVGSALCTRDLLLGMPLWLTKLRHAAAMGDVSAAGASASAATSGKVVHVQYALTVFLRRVDERVRDEIARTAAGSAPALALRPAADRCRNALHVRYIPSGNKREVSLLIASYALLVAYVYFSASKIDTVTWKFGFTVALVVSVASSLAVGTALCTRWELTSTLWPAELYPYLAMAVGLETALCITRAVAETNEDKPVRERIARGLSKEGWSISKNFLMGVCIVAIGYMTRIHEIQEFCAFATVGIAVDYYMQLAFYTPCLAMDMLRCTKRADDCAQTRQHHRDHAHSAADDEDKLHFQTGCPMERLMPQYFDEYRRARYLSDANEDECIVPALSPCAMVGAPAHRYKSQPDLLIDDIDAAVEHIPTRHVDLESMRTHSALTARGHRRVRSDFTPKLVADGNSPPPPRDVVKGQSSKSKKGSAARRSRRLRLFLFWTRTRFISRFLFSVVALWIGWLCGLLFHAQFSLTVPYFNITIDEAVHTASTCEHYQRVTLGWWPALYESYRSNGTTSDSDDNSFGLGAESDTRVATVLLPPIVLKWPVADNFYAAKGRAHLGLPSKDASMHYANVKRDLVAKERIDGELTLSIKNRSLKLLTVTAAIVCCTLFVLYCALSRRTHRRADDRCEFDKGALFEPTVQRVRHPASVSPVEHVAVCSDRRSHMAITCDADGATVVWRLAPDLAPLGPLPRAGGDRGAKTAVWCVCYRHDICALGCADGTVELWHAAALRLCHVLRLDAGTAPLPPPAHVAAPRPRAVGGVTHLCLKGDRLLAVTASVAGRSILHVATVLPAADAPSSLHVHPLNAVYLDSDSRPSDYAHVRCAAMTDGLLALVACSDGRIHAVDARSGTLWQTLRAHNAPIASLFVHERRAWHDSLAFSIDDKGHFGVWRIDRAAGQPHIVPLHSPSHDKREHDLAPSLSDCALSSDGQSLLILLNTGRLNGYTVQCGSDQCATVTVTKWASASCSLPLGVAKLCIMGSGVIVVSTTDLLKFYYVAPTAHWIYTGNKSARFNAEFVRCMQLDRHTTAGCPPTAIAISSGALLCSQGRNLYLIRFSTDGRNKMVN